MENKQTAIVKVKNEGFWQKQLKGLKKHKSILWFILPAFIVSLIFSYIPMLGVTFAFKDAAFSSALRKGANVLGAMVSSNWTLQTFADIFNEEFTSALVNSLIINLIKLFLVFPLSILIAVQLSEIKNQGLAKLILIILCLPNFLSWTVVIKIWSNFFNPDTGFLGQLLSDVLHGESLTYYEWSFRPLFVFYCAWKGSGWGCIMYYAAIMSIDKSYYESATIDGANKLQKMFSLTIPAIAGTIALTLVLTISGFMSVGLEQQMLMLTGSSYYDTQKTLDLYIYELSIGNGAGIRYEQAAALGVFNGFVGLFLMLLGNYITTKTIKRGLW